MVLPVRAFVTALCALLLSCGGDQEAPSARVPPAAPSTLTPLAGDFGGFGSVDGPGDLARFNRPMGLALDPAGDLVVADPGSGLRVVAADGTTTTRQLDRVPPSVGRLAIGPAGHIALVGACGDIARFSPSGEPLPIVYRGGGIPAGPCGDVSRSGVLVDGAGRVTVAGGASGVIRRIDTSGEVTVLAGSEGRRGAADGAVAEALFTSPTGLAADAAGNLSVTDQWSHTVRRITPQGQVTTVAGRAEEAGSQDGPGALATFRQPLGIVAAPDGSLYVADTGNHAIRRIAPDGTVTTVAGMAGEAGHADGIGAQARFSSPDSILLWRDALIVSDTANQSIRRIALADMRVSTLSGRPLRLGHADGWGLSARFTDPRAVASDGAGTLYVADGSVVRKVTADGFVSTIAGHPAQTGTRDGSGIDARFRRPTGVAVDGERNVYVVDQVDWPRGDTLRGTTIRKIAPDGTVSTLAGDPARPGRTDGRGAAASFVDAQGIWATPGGHVVVADRFTVRRITPQGEVSTLGSEIGHRDGAAQDAVFCCLLGITGDAAGNVVLVDGQRVRQLAPDGTVRTLAMTDGGLGPAALGPDGDLWAAEFVGHRILRLQAAGGRHAVVGDDRTSGMRFGPLPGSLSRVRSLAVLDGKTLAVLTPGGIARVGMP